jgi:enamine deaminase RidA (YjgF/YER057c/UK114 family)
MTAAEGMTVTLTAIEPADYPYFPYKGFTFCLGLQDGDAAWTSGQSAAIYDAEVGRMVVDGAMAEQTQLSYTKLLAVLADSGLTTTDVVHVTENVTAAGAPSYDDAAAVRRQIFGGHEPTMTTVVVDRLVRGRALIELELHAIPGGGQVLVATGDLGTTSPVREGHDGTVHLPTVLPIDGSGDVIAVGDPVGQYRFCLQQVADLIKAAGLEAANVVACHEYITVAAREHLPALAELRAEMFGSQIVGGSVVMARLLRDSVQVSLDITLSRRPKSVVDPGWPRFEREALVPAVRAGGSLYLSALSARDRNTGAVVAPGDLGAQADEVYSQMTELLSFAGTDAAALRSTIEFCAADQIATYRVVAGAREKYLSPPWPASTGDLCTGFAVDRLLLQTNAIAHVNS